MEAVEYGTYVWVKLPVDGERGRKRWEGGREGRQVNELQEWCSTLEKRRLGDDGVDGQSENEIADEKGRLV